MIPIQINGRSCTTIDIEEIIKHGVLINSNVQEVIGDKSVRKIIPIIRHDELIVINVVI